MERERRATDEWFESEMRRVFGGMKSHLKPFEAIRGEKDQGRKNKKKEREREREERETERKEDGDREREK